MSNLFVKVNFRLIQILYNYYFLILYLHIKIKRLEYTNYIQLVDTIFKNTISFIQMIFF